MMNQPFSMNGLSSMTTPDFRMMNNNFLPGISRMSMVSGPGGARFESALLGSPFQERTLPAAGIAVDTNGLAGIGGDVSIETGITGHTGNSVRLSCNISEGSVLGTNIAVTDLPAYAKSEQVSVANNVPGNFCVNQGSVGCGMNNRIQVTGVSTVNLGWTNTVYPPCQSSVSNFTFTTPTQSYLHSPALTATTQSRFQYSRVMPQAFAPGCSAQWQHTSPRRVPRLRHRTMSCPQGISIFTGSQSSSVCSISSPDYSVPETSTFFSSSMKHPVASCSQYVHRPKRRHTTDSVQIVDELSPPGRKIHLTEEKIARHMKELRLHNISPPPDPSVYDDNAFNSLASQERQPQRACLEMEDLPEISPELQSMTDAVAGHTPSSEFLKHSQRQWHDFKLLEEKLEMIDEDSCSEDGEDLSSRQPKLHIVGDIREIKSEPVIPEDILKKICNPCTQVMVWTPPGGAAKQEDEDEAGEGNQEVESGSDMIDDIIINNMQSEEDGVREDSGMETEDEDLDL